jgi:uncharacterized protein (TIGR02145 family)
MKYRNARIMKNLFKSCFIATLSLLLSNFNSSAQSVGINSTGAAPAPSALLDLSSTNKGFLITRVDTASIATPAFGLMTLAPIDSCLYMFSGLNWISLGGVGASCPCFCDTSSTTPPSSFPCGGTVIPIVEVINAVTGKTWMDRNLGASQVADSSKHVASYGDLYQWGRCSDGHEKRTSTLSTTLSLTDTPGNSNFIGASVTPFDWRSGQNNALWQGLNGINNPCPTGYRIPTTAEWNAERLSWSVNTSVGAFDSPLKLPMSGWRLSSSGGNGGNGSNGRYWTSTISTTNVNYLTFSPSAGSVSTLYRAYGFAVRCIKD